MDGARRPSYHRTNWAYRFRKQVGSPEHVHSTRRCHRVRLVGRRGRCHLANEQGPPRELTAWLLTESSHEKGPERLHSYCGLDSAGRGDRRLQVALLRPRAISAFPRLLERERTSVGLPLDGYMA